MTNTTHRMRLKILALLVLGSLGLGAELVLMEHDEGWRQALPLWALGAAVVALVGYAFAGRGMACNVMRCAMLGLIICGLAGVYLHYVSNEEFQRELNPSLRGWGLMLATMRSHSPPSLAPAALLLLGAIGWVAIDKSADRGDA